ncbi:hypothetical protein [Paenibacillus apiarius]|uniref:Uncharacterized protein n=1 Tax=Paenibacillus apiarius TaxID=46240 RepID=A0ABT4DU30_9BACL|nr:hypothetical protein [Paenibacillus apiarius]MCY9515901.1 hypothetical protein [Paenibacillus apiarius]MCY9520811.1 hypothetical protein [Paenibacillus apiarius]MCY9553516.1 hypothetical protein [Paenibacillus apiarius]MCY9557961.1 hypothetical protein [Paenibacillus apiarius]MCY9685816.1 hypothetical protein [Paenibacillus apiarius]
MKLFKVAVMLILTLSLVVPATAFGASSSYSGVSGKRWVQEFPNSANVSDLSSGFRPKVEKFIKAMKDANITVTVTSTLRPKERAYLMHYSYKISKGQISPKDVPSMSGVNIQWVHPNDDSKYTNSKKAAAEMVAAYSIVAAPALDSDHIRGNAIDMNSPVTKKTTIKKADGTSITISNYDDLVKVGATYGVYHLMPVSKDPVHWSNVKS